MFYELNPIEVTGAVFGLLSVILTAKENIWCWPTGIISVLAYILFYYQQTLYASMLLQVFFLFACIQGWYQWLYGGENKTRLRISRTHKKHFWILAGITLFFFVLMGVLSDFYTNDKMPYLDALLTSMSFTAQWMMNNKLIECWPLWIVIDILYAGMHYKMKTYPSFILYVSYIVTASAAYYMWIQSFKRKRTSP